MRRIILYVALVLAVMVGTAYGLTISRTDRVFEAMVGGTLVVKDSLTIQDEGFQIAQNALTASGFSPLSPVMFPNGAAGPGSVDFAQIQTPAGNWVLYIVVRTTLGTPANALFEVQIGSARGGISIAASTLYLATGATIAENAGVVCQFDVGPFLQPPISYTVTVRKTRQ